jgi:hypothetical protein
MSRAKREMDDYERDAMIDRLRCGRSWPTEYVVPEKGERMKALYAI